MPSDLNDSEFWRDSMGMARICNQWPNHLFEKLLRSIPHCCCLCLPLCICFFCMICQRLSLVFVFAFPYFCLFQIVTERISRCLLQRGRIDRLIAQFPHSGKTARIMSSICSTCKVVWSERKFKILFSSLFNKFPLRNWSWVRTTVCKYALSSLKHSMDIGQKKDGDVAGI